MKKIYFLLLLATAIVFASQIATVTGLDPNGDGFLSIRTKPKGKEIGKLYNEDKVKVLDKRGKWYKIKSIKNGITGWSHSNWITVNSISSAKSYNVESTKYIKKDGTLLEQLSYIKIPTTYTYSSIDINQHGISIWKIVQTTQAIKIYLKVSRSDGVIYTRDSICTKPGFFQCKRWENLLYHIRTDNDIIKLSKITNVKVKSSIIAQAKESVKYEKKAQQDRTRARYLLTQKVDKLKSYKKGILIVNDDGGVRQLEISDLSSSKIILYFPYKGKRLKQFDLREGYDGSWNFNNIRLTKLSNEEIKFQNNILNVLKNNKKLLDNLSDDDMQSLVKKYKKYSDVSQYISKELLNKVKKENDIELRLAKFINSNVKYKNNALEAVVKLKKILAEKRDLSLYFKVFEILDADNPYILPIASDMTKLIWEETIKPSNDVSIVIQFIVDFKEASGEVISDAYDYALKLESKKLNKDFNNMLKENNGQLSKFDVQERIARRLFMEAVRAKENNNNVKFTIKYFTSINDPLLSETEAAFNLYRDKEMKEFFRKELAVLNQNQRESTMEVIQSINDLRQTLNIIAENTHVSEQTQEDIDSANQRFLMQSLIFDKVHRRDNDN